MMRWLLLCLLSLVSAGTGACAQDGIPDTRIGLNQPPPGVVRTFSWPKVPGASAYQLVISLDRGGTQPIATAGFTADTRLGEDALAWREGHPIVERPYFWMVRAYDRPDPQGLLLSVSDAREVRFQGRLAASAGVMVNSPSPSPAVSASPAPLASAVPAP